jgi:hypothetical protein
MKTSAYWAASALVCLLPSLVGCSSTGEPSDAPEARGVEHTESALLASLDLGDGHAVKFLEAGQGGVTVFEVVPTNDVGNLVLNERFQGMAPGEIYAQLAPPNSVIPEPLLEADARFREIQSRGLVDVGVPPTSDTKIVTEAPHFYDDAQDAANFRQVCTSRSTKECLIQVTSASATNWWNGKSAMVIGATNSVAPALVLLFYYEFEPLFSVGTWVPAGSSWLSLQTYPGLFTFWRAAVYPDEHTGRVLPGHKMYLALLTDG